MASIIQEGIVLDPFEFAPEREELDLDGLGLSVRVDGADWGESQVEAFMVEQRVGSTPVGLPKVPNVDISIPLRASEDDEQPLATPLHQLQQKVQAMREPAGGWLRRDFDEAGGFSGSVACRIFRPSLSGLQGWLFAHRQDAPDIILKATRSPYWYATIEQEGETVSAEGARELIWELEEILGSAPGLITIRVDNEDAEPWRGAIGMIESRDYPQDGTGDTTAKAVYACKDLTPLGAAAVATVEGDEVVEHTGLTAGGVAILDTEIIGAGHMTHRGPRRIRCLARNPGADEDGVQIWLEWRALGSLRWKPNDVVEVPATDDYLDVDLGEVRPERAVVGDERWEGRIVARATSGAGSVILYRFRPETTEQRVLLRAETASSTPEAQSTKSPSTAANDSSDGEVAWENPSSAKTSDDLRATVKLKLSEPDSEWLKLTDYAFAIPEDATIIGIAVAVERSGSNLSVFSPKTRIRMVVGGVVDGSSEITDGSVWPATDEVKVYSDYAMPTPHVWGRDWTAGEINDSGFGAAIRCSGIAAEVKIDSVKITVYYTEAEDENRVCFAERSIEFRSDGIYRQHPTDDVWGAVVPDEGFYLEAPPSLLEARKARVMVVPSAGDLATLPDSGSHKLGGQVFYRPAYLFAREAAS